MSITAPGKSLFAMKDTDIAFRVAALIAGDTL
jgi:hypothetical protein